MLNVLLMLFMMMIFLHCHVKTPLKLFCSVFRSAYRVTVPSADIKFAYRLQSKRAGSGSLLMFFHSPAMKIEAIYARLQKQILSYKGANIYINARFTIVNDGPWTGLRIAQPQALVKLQAIFPPKRRGLKTSPHLNSQVTFTASQANSDFKTQLDILKALFCLVFYLIYLTSLI